MAKSPFFVENRPLTRADELRRHLDELEAQVGRLGYGLSQPEALAIPRVFDVVSESLASFQAQGQAMRGEEARLAAVSAAFRRKAAAFLRDAGGAQAVQDARRARRPDPAAWWWFLDEWMASRRRALLRSLLLVGAGVLAVLLALFALYQRFLAPDEATLARIRLQQAAENLALQGDVAGALEKVEQALVNAPRDPYLLVFKGTLQQELEQESAAEQSFEAAQGALGNREDFLLARGEAYLLLKRAPAALADARAAVELNSQSASGYLLLGRAYEIMEDYPQAIQAYQQASALAEEQGDFQTAAAARVAMGMLMQR